MCGRPQGSVDRDPDVASREEFFLGKSAPYWTSESAFEQVVRAVGTASRPPPQLFSGHFIFQIPGLPAWAHSAFPGSTALDRHLQ